MRKTVIAASGMAVVAVLCSVSLASGQTPGASVTPTSAPVSPTPTPTPAPATPTTPVPSYDGRPCETGLLINDFIVLGDREPVPACVVPFATDGSEILYGLSPVPAGLQLRGLTEQTTRDGVRIVSVVYETVGGTPPFGPPDGRAVVTISLQKDGLTRPEVVNVLLKGTVSEGNFLPSPGLLILPSAASQIGMWFGPSGVYRMDVDQSVPGVPLEIEQLAALLAPVDVSSTTPPPTPRAPSTGSAPTGEAGSSPGWMAGFFACAIAAAAAGIGHLLARRRRPRTASHGGARPR